jgi:hypothetical protein
VTEFHKEIQLRALEARQSLAEARDAGDDYLAGIRLGEMQSLARIAAEHGVALEGIAESLAAHGLPTPAAGISPPVQS